MTSTSTPSGTSPTTALPSRSRLKRRPPWSNWTASASSSASSCAIPRPTSARSGSAPTTSGTAQPPARNLYKGEGVVAGIIDTGINLGHPSFADVGGDGYNHTNPLGSGNYLGLCLSNPGVYVCNDKTYGFYIFTGEVSEDGDGHGSHTGSTTAGNYLQPGTVDLSPFNTYSPAISGVAPHANVIGYKACLDAGGCPGAALVSCHQPGHRQRRGRDQLLHRRRHQQPLDRRRRAGLPGCPGRRRRAGDLGRQQRSRRLRLSAPPATLPG